MLILYMMYYCILVTLYVLVVSSLLCNVDVMISTLQKCLQDALLSLVGPSSSFRIGSHLGRDTFMGRRIHGLSTGRMIHRPSTGHRIHGPSTGRIIILPNMGCTIRGP